MQSDLVSLKASMDRLERGESLFRKALDCYLAALSGVEQKVFEPFAAKTGREPLSLEPARQGLRRHADEPSFDRARTALDEALGEASDRLRRQMAGTVELEEVLRVLAEATGSLHRQRTAQESRVAGVASNLEEAARLEDVEEFRQKILHQVRALGEIVEHMREENRTIIAELEREMTAYRRKLDEAHSMANRDTLTGLANRRFLEIRVDEHILSETSFCLLLIDLDRFKQVNDIYGHLAGDEFLRLFAARLRKHLRPDDVASRWGGDEFVVLMPCGLRDAIVRAKALEEALRGVYSFKVEDRLVRIHAGLTIGVAEYRKGESAEQLMARADTVLYQKKGGR
jgi:diguanylate cyclase (GGDEF)-like protein